VKIMAWLTGYPREKINWFPTIDPDKCVKCGMCINCGKNVYDWTEDGSRVARPYQCVVGCTTCANLCLGNAIAFMDIEEVRDIYRREGIWAKVKKQLAEEGKLQVRKEPA
jgi:MinD superfamily P-loop ATPase